MPAIAATFAAPRSNDPRRVERARRRQSENSRLAQQGEACRLHRAGARATPPRLAAPPRRMTHHPERR